MPFCGMPHSIWSSWGFCNSHSLYCLFEKRDYHFYVKEVLIAWRWNRARHYSSSSPTIVRLEQRRWLVASALYQSFTSFLIGQLLLWFIFILFLTYYFIEWQAKSYFVLLSLRFFWPSYWYSYGHSHFDP